MLHNATVLSDYGVALDGFGNALALAIGTVRARPTSTRAADLLPMRAPIHYHNGHL